MRYYKIAIENIKTQKPVLMSDGTPFGPYSSTSDGTVSGTNLPGALDVELDLPVNDFATPTSAGYVKIHGIGLQAIGQATQFNPDFSAAPSGTNYPATCNISVYGGMRAGLPLATAAAPFAGLLLQSQVQQGFGNWQGNDQTLEFVCLGPYGAPDDAKNIIFEWRDGQDLADAITVTLTNAFPGSKVVSRCQNIQMPWKATQPAKYDSVEQFAYKILELSQSIVQGDYLGVRIAPTSTGFTLYDGTRPLTPVQLKLTDLIGQPTWKDVATISFKTPMRADLQLGTYVQMPKGPQLLSPQSNVAFRDKAAFTDSYQVLGVRHLGHFRQKSADAWVSCFEAQANPLKTGTVTVGG